FALLPGDRPHRTIPALVTAGLFAIQLVLQMDPTWALALSAASAGAWVAWRYGREASTPSVLGPSMPLLSGALTGILTTCGARIALLLGGVLINTSAPAVIALGFSGAVVALFFALGQWPAHLQEPADPIEKELDQARAGLAGEWRALVDRALAR